MIDRSFWKDRRVFLTGHTGFKGAWLGKWLSMMGARVRGYALEPPTKPSLFESLNLGACLDSVIGDIRNAAEVDRAMMEFEPDIVFQFAAQPLVRLSYAEPKQTYETNVMGAINMYEAVRRCDSVHAIISITTDKCYENREWVWGYRESDPMGGYDPYSSSKACVEILSAAYRQSFFNPAAYESKHHVALATARAGNVIGGGDWAADRLVPDCVRALSEGREIVMRNPHSTRPWQHVLEPLGGYLLLAQKLRQSGPIFGEGWNFGPGDSGIADVETVVRRIIDAWGSGTCSCHPDGGPHEAQLLKLDISKAVARLGWKPTYSIVEAVTATAEWYSSYYHDPASATKTTERQIMQFESDIGAS
jgi:CDP-glucose 4,6-dehydratase